MAEVAADRRTTPSSPFGAFSTASGSAVEDDDDEFADDLDDDALLRQLDGQDL